MRECHVDIHIHPAFSDKSKYEKKLSIWINPSTRSMMMTCQKNLCRNSIHIWPQVLGWDWWGDSVPTQKKGCIFEDGIRFCLPRLWSWKS